MKLSELVKEGTQQRPPRIVLHATHGAGKSTWGAGAPSPIFLQTEDGLSTIDVPHFPLAKTLDEVWGYMAALLKEDHEYKTFVLDTADWLQKLIWDKVCEERSVESIESIGYAKGYLFAMKHWERFLAGCEKLRDKGMIVVILAHNEIKTFTPPDGEAYDRYQIKLHRHAATKLEEWADCVLFANFKVYTQGKQGEAQKAVNTDPERVIHTANRPAWRAKTRYKLPDEMPLDFMVLLKAIITPQTPNKKTEEN